MIGRHRLTHHMLVLGLNCPRRLYSTVYQSGGNHKSIQECYPAMSPHAVDTLQRGFPGGVDAIVRPGEQPEAWLGWTEELIQAGTPVIYNAAIAFDGVLARIDVLKRENFGWKAVIASENMDANQQEWSTALMAYLVEGAGILLTALSLVIIDADGERDEIRSVLMGARARSKAVPEWIDTCREVLDAVHQPAALVGPHCSHPEPCHLMERCFSNEI
jgi:hypothetical protein